MREHVKEIGSSSVRIQAAFSPHLDEVVTLPSTKVEVATGKSDAARESKDSEAPANRNAERDMSH